MCSLVAVGQSSNRVCVLAKMNGRVWVKQGMEKNDKQTSVGCIDMQFFTPFIPIGKKKSCIQARITQSDRTIWSWNGVDISKTAGRVTRQRNGRRIRIKRTRRTRKVHFLKETRNGCAVVTMEFCRRNEG